MDPLVLGDSERCELFRELQTRNFTYLLYAYRTHLSKTYKDDALKKFKCQQSLM